MPCPAHLRKGRTIIERLTLGIVACFDDEREILTLKAFGSEPPPISRKNNLCYFLQDFMQILYSVEQAGPP